MKWTYHILYSPISQGLCFELVLSSVLSPTDLSGAICNHEESCRQNCQEDDAYCIFFCIGSI